MTHSQSKIKVYQTTDYKVFRLVQGNRAINKKKVERIIREISAGNDVLDECPILVAEHGGKLDVKDGQHRLEVARQLKRPVHYIIKAQEMSLYNVAKMNSNTERWKAQDFINCYVQLGNDHYRKIQAFHKKYGISIGLSLLMLTNGTIMGDGSGIRERLTADFEHGTFEVKKYKEACQVAEICKNFEASSAWNTRPFIIAICRILAADKCDFDVLMKKFNRDPSRLTSQASWKAYLTILEEIYNIGNSKRQTIF